MANTSYSAYSPYSKTSIVNGYLDISTWRSIPAASNDTLLEITAKYQNRPDLLANDIYGDSRLWWVFAVRNPDIIQDPIYDLTAGLFIYIPQMTNIRSALGV
jgi:hypothetical protein